MIQPLMADTKLEHLRLLDNLEECVICLEDVTLNSYAKPGNERDWDKRYHINCLDKWFRYSNKGIVSDDPEDCYIVYAGFEPTNVVPVSRHTEQVKPDYSREDPPVVVIDLDDHSIDNRVVIEPRSHEICCTICLLGVSALIMLGILFIG